GQEPANIIFYIVPERTGSTIIGTNACEWLKKELSKDEVGEEARVVKGTWLKPREEGVVKVTSSGTGTRVLLPTEGSCAVGGVHDVNDEYVDVPVRNVSEM